MKTAVVYVRRAALALLVLLLLGIGLPYAWTPVYDFPEARPFSGSHLYNPYEAHTARWQRANFHAHGRAWSGLTNGQQSDNEVAQSYRDLGYDVPGVSDYQRIAARYGVPTIPVYEHGYNIIKQHQLAIGAHDVEWFDFLLWQSRNGQQYVIDRVKRKSDLVALAHPATRDAYTADDMRALTNYDLIEVVNGPFTAADVWDSALSSGRAVWAVADDDTHDLLDLRRRAAGWNMVGAATPETSDIVQALAAGRTYAVLRKGALEHAHVTVLDGIELAGHTMRVALKGAPSTITFVGQDGAVRKTVDNALVADYDWTDADTYVRTRVDTPYTVLFVNPVVRYDGVSLARPTATMNVAATWTSRGSWGLGAAALALLLVRRRAALLPSASAPLLATPRRTTA